MSTSWRIYSRVITFDKDLTRSVGGVVTGQSPSYIYHTE